MPILDIAFEHAVTYMPRGGRVERTERATCVMPVMVAEPGPAEAPRILDIEWPRTDRGRVFDLAGLRTMPVPVHRYRGSAMRPWNLFRKDASEGVVPDGERGPDLPPRGMPVRIADPGAPEGLAKLPPVPEGALDRARRCVSGEADARTRVLDAVSSMCVVDGILFEPCGEPVWTLHAGHSTSRPRIDLMPDFAPCPHPFHHPVFRADRVDDALGHAAWMAEARSREGRVAPAPTLVGGIRPSPAYAAPAGMAHAYGAAVVAAFDAARLGQGFPRLPRDCLLAWVDFRDLAGPASAGDPVAVEAALEAMERLAAALPDEAAHEGDGEWHLRNSLPGALRVFRLARDREAGNGLAADEAALTGLVPG